MERPVNSFGSVCGLHGREMCCKPATAGTNIRAMRFKCCDATRLRIMLVTIATFSGTLVGQGRNELGIFDEASIIASE
jgi:hypothetical protein